MISAKIGGLRIIKDCGFTEMRVPHRPRRDHGTEQGFTLIEVAIALAIIGLLLVPFLQQYNIEQVQFRENTTKGNIGTVEQALRKYNARYGRYPRPADPFLGPQDANYGLEVAIPGGGFTACGAVRTGGICQAVGQRDTNVDADSDITNEFVYSGSIPFATLGIAPETALDSWRNKLLYTVTASQTSTATMRDDTGVIGLEDNLGAAQPGTSDNIHFIIVSTGSDERGAHRMDGPLVMACAGTRDGQNCNEDSLFDDGSIRTHITKPFAPKKSDTLFTGADSWNDYFTYITSVTTDIWSPISNSTSIMSNISGGIRVNLSNPVTNPVDSMIRLDVGGIVRADTIFTNSLGTTPTNTAAPCTGSDYCLPGEALGMSPGSPASGTTGPGIRCALDAPMTGVSFGDEQCNSVTVNTDAVVNFTCPTDQAAYGVDANGRILCRTP